MATVLDVSFLGNIMPIWVLILVFAIVYALLVATKALGDNKNIAAIVAIVVAIAAILSKRVVAFIGVFIPWIVVAFIFLIFLIIAMRMFHGDVTSIQFPFPAATLGWIIFIFVLVIGIGSFASVVGPSQVEVTEGAPAMNASTGTTTASGSTGTTVQKDYSTRVGSTFYHPKILGFILIILVAVFGMALLTTVPSKPEGNGGHH